MNKLPLDSVVEAMLIGTGEAVSLDQMRRAIVDVGEVEGGVAKLNKRIAQVIGKLQAACDGRPVELKETAAGFRYVTRTDYAPFISSLKGQ